MGAVSASPPDNIGAGDRARRWERARWIMALAALLAAIVALGVMDRRGPPQLDSTTAGTTLPARIPSPGQPAAKPLARTFDLPEGLSGSLFVVGDDEVLTEIDLGSGNSRVAELNFEVERWYVNQVVPLRDIVLVATRRDVYAIDRATLKVQRHVAEGTWVSAAPDGSWAALVPYGSGGGDVRFIDGAGARIPGPDFHLPAGVDIIGLSGEQLVLDVAGVVGVVDRQNRPGPLSAPGRPLALSDGGIARLVCAAPTTCELRVGTLGAPDAVRSVSPNLAGPWAFGPGAVLSSDGGRLAYLGSGPTGVGLPRVEVLDLRAGTVMDSPSPVGVHGPLPPVAFSPEGKAIVHISEGGVALWQPDADTNGNGVETTELSFDADVVAVGVSPSPPPPPEPAGGPPPSYA